MDVLPTVDPATKIHIKSDNQTVRNPFIEFPVTLFSDSICASCGDVLPDAASVLSARLNIYYVDVQTGGKLCV